MHVFYRVPDRCVEHDGTVKWLSSNVEGTGDGGPALADLDGDGAPEIILGWQVLNNDGSLRWTGTGGAPAEISRDEGGPFSCFGDRIVGRQVELVPDRRIVQAWRAADWEDGVYSVVRFELREDGKGTRLVFDQSGFPQGEKGHLEAGWPKMYWEPLQEFLT